jgi:nuclear pore complex protein Nup54
MSVNLTGDERDAIISRWNLIQAQWGTGKGTGNKNSCDSLLTTNISGYYNNNVPPVTFTQQNIFCRFKALGYNLLPSSKEEEGIVSLTIGKKESEVK